MIYDIDDIHGSFPYIHFLIATSTALIFLGQSTINGHFFNSYVCLPEGICRGYCLAQLPLSNHCTLGRGAKLM